MQILVFVFIGRSLQKDLLIQTQLQILMFSAAPRRKIAFYLEKCQKWLLKKKKKQPKKPHKPKNHQTPKNQKANQTQPKTNKQTLKTCIRKVTLVSVILVSPVGPLCIYMRSKFLMCLCRLLCYSGNFQTQGFHSDTNILTTIIILICGSSDKFIGWIVFTRY